MTHELEIVAVVPGVDSFPGHSRGLVRITSLAARGVAEAAPRVPVLLGHRGRPLGVVSSWRIRETDGALIAVARLESLAGVEVGRPASLEFVADSSRLDDRSGVRVVGALSVDALALMPEGERGLFRGAEVIGIREVPTAPKPAASLRSVPAGGHLSAWEKGTGLPAGHSVGNFGGTVPKMR